VRFIPNANCGAGAGGSRCRTTGRRVRQARIHPGAAAATAAVLAATAVATAAALSLAAPAASASSAGRTAAAAQRAPALQALSLHAMPVGTVRFGRAGHGRLTVHARVSGLTPGSSHAVDLRVPGHSRVIRFSTLTANNAGQASSTLHSRFSGPLRRGSRLLVRMGAQGGRLARTPIAGIRWLRDPGRGTHRLIAAEVSQRGVRYGTPHGRATLAYNASRQTLTVTVHASGVTPGPHAAHIHLGSCMSQGPVKYMLPDLVANRRGRIAHAIRVFTHVTAPVPDHGWYLNIHQGNSGNILSNGQPTIYFRPLLCADIHGGGGGSLLHR
jgi:Cu/Zn superoxide dismutase